MKFSGQAKFAAGADIAAASTVDLSLATGNSLTITGNTTITSFGTVENGVVFFITFSGTPTITHNGTSLILPSGANIIASAGDSMVLRSLGNGNWKCVSYEKANGKAIVVDDVSKIIDQTYPAGETLSAGNVVFIENAPTTAQATSAQNIGDVTANTRVSFPVFGSGVAGTTLALNLAKTGSPSVALGVRIETDNAGSPSGTLVDANATGTVAAASILNTGMVLGESSVTDTDTVNSLSQTTGVYSTSVGRKILSKYEQLLTTVTKSASCTATDCILMDSTRTSTLSTVSFVGNTATFSYKLDANTEYYILADKVGDYVMTYDSTTTSPVNGTNVIFYADTTGPVGNYAYNIESVSTTALQTTVTLAGSITIPAGQKCHIVTFQGTYGSETVNASNYYKIGYYPIDTTTRFGKKYNGSAWSTFTASGTFNESTNDTLGSPASSALASGYKVLCLRGGKIDTVVQLAGGARCLIKDSTGTTLYTANFAGNDATFTNAFIKAGEIYRIEVDSSGGNYTRYSDASTANPTHTVFQYLGGSVAGADNTTGYNIQSIIASIDTIVPYTSSTLFQPRVLSKTDADFSYKIDWHGITQEVVTAGNLTTGKYPKIAISGIDSNQTGMTQGATQYLGNTAGSISSSAGTNSKKIGKAISDTKIKIVDIPL